MWIIKGKKNNKRRWREREREGGVVVVGSESEDTEEKGEARKVREETLKKLLLSLVHI